MPIINIHTIRFSYRWTKTCKRQETVLHPYTRQRSIFLFEMKFLNIFFFLIFLFFTLFIDQIGNFLLYLSTGQFGCERNGCEEEGLEKQRLSIFFSSTPLLASSMLNNGCRKHWVQSDVEGSTLVS